MGPGRVTRLPLAHLVLLSSCVAGGPRIGTPALDLDPPPCGAWHLAASPFGGPGSSFLSGAGAAAPDDAWAVGVRKDPRGRGRTLTLHWDGRVWARVPSPNAPGEDFLNDVDVARGVVWAVGIRRGTDGIARTLTLRWDAGTWRIVRSPNAGPADNFLTGVAVRSASDAWAVGYSILGGSSRALALHWNGVRWSIAPTPDLPGLGESLNGVAVVSADEAWAVGAHTPNGYPTQPLVLRWDGRSWERQPDPVTSERPMSISSVVATPDGSLVAVGGFRSLRGDGAIVLTARRHDWSVVPRDTVGKVSESFSGVAAFSDGVWAVGSYSDGGPARTLIERSGGEGWSSVTSPNVEQEDSRLYAVTALPSGEAWAVGNSSGADALERTLIVHYCPA